MKPDEIDHLSKLPAARVCSKNYAHCPPWLNCLAAILVLFGCFLVAVAVRGGGIEEPGAHFGDSEDDPRLATLESKERSLHKGTGSESLVLADWTSLHLEIIALDEALNRLGVSLYQL